MSASSRKPIRRSNATAPFGSRLGISATQAAPATPKICRCSTSRRPTRTIEFVIARMSDDDDEGIDHIYRADFW